MSLVKKLKEDVNKTIAIASLVGMLGSGVFALIEKMQAHEIMSEDEEGRHISDKERVFIPGDYSLEQREKIENKLQKSTYGLIELAFFTSTYGYALFSHTYKKESKKENKWKQQDKHIGFDNKVKQNKLIKALKSDN